VAFCHKRLCTTAI